MSGKTRGAPSDVLATFLSRMAERMFAPAREEADWPLFYQDFQDKARRVGGSVIIERMPNILRERDTPVWAPLLADFPLMRCLKERLDPPRMWNPGRFIGRL